MAGTLVQLLVHQIIAADQNFECTQTLGCFQIEGNRHIQVLVFTSLWHWLCHLPVPLRLSFHWLHHLACQPCVYSVLCTAAIQDFLDSVQGKDQTLVFLTYCDLKSFRIISKQSNTWIRLNSICPSWEDICIINNACLDHCISLACFILL